MAGSNRNPHKWRSSEIFGARWEDNGLCKSAAEIVKYFAKGDDLGLLAEMACSVPEWADDEFNLLGCAHLVARRLASSTRDGRPAEAFLGKAISHVQKLAAALCQRARAGAPHPFVWLFHQLFDLNIAQPMGDFRAMRRGLRLHHQRVMSVATGDGDYVLCRVERGRREVCETPGDVLIRENEVLSRTSPQPRFTPYGEPVLLVRNYTAQPRTMVGMLALRRMQDQRLKARKAWLGNGAPLPEEAIDAVRAATAAARPQLCEDAAAGGSVPYSSHYNDNCGDDLPYSTPCGDLIDRSTGEVLFECPPTDVGDRFEWWNPDNWGLEIKAKHSVLIDKMSAARFLWTKESREKLLRTYDLLSAIEAVLK